MNTVLTDEERHRFQDPKTIQNLLRNSTTIAMVGLSDKPHRPSYFVATYLQSEGYRVIPVNPRATQILGEKSYPDLKSIPSDIQIDVVDIFRRANECPAIVQDAIDIGAKAVWLQLRVVNTEAGQTAIDAGLDAIMDRCIKMEHGRYNGSLHWVGMNTEIISAKKARRL